MLEPIVRLIVDRLESEKGRLRQMFLAPPPEIPVRHFIIDDLLPKDLAIKFSAAFPKAEDMRLMKSFRETKRTSKNFNQFDPLIKEITFAFQDQSVISVIEQITELKDQLADPQLYAGGLSLMEKGHFLNPHIDNSHDGQRKNYRTLNLLYYITPNWREGDGGHLELWDEQVKNKVILHSFFNRLAVMQTTPVSWHSVSKVFSTTPRLCVSNYYFSPHSPTGKDYFHITSFSGRPEEPLKRATCVIDNWLRTSVRWVVKSGLGKKDVYVHNANSKIN